MLKMTIKSVNQVLICMLLILIGGIFSSCDDDNSDNEKEDNSSGSANVPDDDDDDDNDDDNDNNDDDDNDLVEGPYYQDFLQYWETMDTRYAYFLVKDIDWQSVWDNYSATAFAEDNAADFSLMIASITASLQDSHTFSYLNSVPAQKLPYRSPTGVCLERINGFAYVSRLTQEAITAGMQLGDKVLDIDGENIDTLLERSRGWEGCSSDHCCDFYRLPHVDRYSKGETAVIYSITRNGNPLQITIDRSGGSAGTCQRQSLIEFLSDASGTILKYKAIDQDIGYVQLDTLSDGYSTVIEQELDLALTSFAGQSALIFDARYNHGGSDMTAMKILARFLGEWIWPVSFRYKLGAAHDSFTPWIPEPVAPGSSPTTLPVAFLINGGCISAADFFVGAASYVPTFTLIGTTSCGATGAPDHETLPVSGITYYFSQMQRKYLATGDQIEGIGIAPDIFVQQDADDLALGVDTQLEAAIEFLRQDSLRIQ